MVDLDQLVGAAAARQPRAVARLISLVEDGGPLLRSVAPLLAARQAALTDRSQIIGLTGPPGVGKSTTTAALVAAYRALGRRVAVLAVDPSSPFSGGALLGDRVRMQDHALDDDVFIRSMASRGHLGGLSWATPQALRVLEVAGFDVILIETVGVGQAEVDIASHADTTLVLTAPGMGDAIQASKAGILEIADVFVVNKADRDGADQTSRDLRQMLALGESKPEWLPPIEQTVASSGRGIPDVMEAIEKHRLWLESSGRLSQVRLRRVADEIQAIAVEATRQRFGDGSLLPELAAAVMAGTTDPYSAADDLLAAVSAGAVAAT